MVIRFLSVILILTGSIFNSTAQTPAKPKLVVGIVVDQMRYDYLERFKSSFGKDGFLRLMNEGSNFTFAHYNYIPTYTAPGHAAVYTGTTPYFNGIIANDWYSRKYKKYIYCVEDSSVKGVGSVGDEGMRSPKNLVSSTITDQLQLSNNGKSKVISVSIKDRGSILPGGHLSDGSFWYDGKNGKFITSTFFMNELPTWVQTFNSRKLPDDFLKRTWNLTFTLNNYANSFPDESPYEVDIFNEGKTSFPHHLDKIEQETKYTTLIHTPFGNDLLLEFAKTALVSENLGKSDVPDFLAISFSSTDYIGHTFGPNSVEIMDTYIKLDAQLAELFSALDKQVGKGNYLLFLTADHGVVENIYSLADENYSAGNVVTSAMSDSVKSFFRKKYGTDQLLEKISNDQIFLDWNLIAKMTIDPKTIQNEVRQVLRYHFPQISTIYIRSELETRRASRTAEFLLNGFNPARSGDVMFEVQASYITDAEKRGTTHGSPYNYDTHVPFLFYGWNIPVQTTNEPVYICDISATVANLLGIMEPDGSMGIPVIKLKK